MRLSSISFLLGESFQNVRRNGLMSLATLGTVSVALAVLGGTVWTVHRVNDVVEQKPETFNAVDVFVKTDVGTDKLAALQTRIAQIPDVGSVQLVTRAEAWNALRAQKPDLKDELEENPLPDKFEVKARMPDRVPKVAALLSDSTQYPELSGVKAAAQEVRTVLAFSRLVKVIGGLAAFVLFIATMFIVQNTIRLSVIARRREIRIMQLVGASPSFVRLPLLVEGLFHGTAGALLGGGVVIFCAYHLSRFVEQVHSPLVGSVPVRLNDVQVVAALVVTGAFIGLSGSYISVRRFLRQQ